MNCVVSSSLIEILEFLALAPARERRRRPRLARLPAAEPRPGIALPRAVIDRAGRRLAELAVIDDVDADRRLARRDLAHGIGKPRGIFLGVEIRARDLGAVDLDQPLGPRQAAGVRGENSVGAALHGFLPRRLNRMGRAHSSAEREPRAPR